MRALAIFLLMSSLAASAEAPAVHTYSGRFDRVVVVRMKNGADMLDGLKQAVAREKIQNAVILSGHGSVTSYHIHVVDNTTLPAHDAFLKGEGAYDILTTSGHIINGRVHCHITLASTTKTLGGHLEPGTRTFTFSAVAIGVLDGKANLDKLDDANWR